MSLFKSYLIKNNKISEDWNALNIISENAATVGGFDLRYLQNNRGSNEILKDLENNKFELIYLLGQDNIRI